MCLRAYEMKKIILTSSSEFNTAFLYDTDYAKPVFLVEGHTAPVISVDWHSNRQFILTGSTDNSIKLSLI